MRFLINLSKSMVPSFSQALAIIGCFLAIMGGTNLIQGNSLLAQAQQQDIPVKQLRIANDVLAGDALGEFIPYESESGNIMARSREFFKSENGQYAAGIWEGKPGSMNIEDAPYAEVMYILEGSMMMGSPGKDPITYNAGEGVVMPKGWSGTGVVSTNGARVILFWHRNDR